MVPILGDSVVQEGRLFLSLVRGGLKFVTGLLLDKLAEGPEEVLCQSHAELGWWG